MYQYTSPVNGQSARRIDISDDPAFKALADLMLSKLTDEEKQNALVPSHVLAWGKEGIDETGKKTFIPDEARLIFRTAEPEENGYLYSETPVYGGANILASLPQTECDAADDAIKRIASEKEADLQFSGMCSGKLVVAELLPIDRYESGKQLSAVTETVLNVGASDSSFVDVSADGITIDGKEAFRKNPKSLGFCILTNQADRLEATPEFPQYESTLQPPPVDREAIQALNEFGLEVRAYDVDDSQKFEDFPDIPLEEGDIALLNYEDNEVTVHGAGGATTYEVGDKVQQRMTAHIPDDGEFAVVPLSEYDEFCANQAEQNGGKKGRPPAPFEMD